MIKFNYKKFIYKKKKKVKDKYLIIKTYKKIYIIVIKIV